ncbi:hypothetical protein C8R45DRAFT_944692 [Mycena sanguinolenta]|nr:hypothetical protein C8R45DRAFT_944692 [Mycena sanguinolenta]
MEARRWMDRWMEGKAEETRNPTLLVADTAVLELATAVVPVMGGSSNLPEVMSEKFGLVPRAATNIWGVYGPVSKCIRVESPPRRNGPPCKQAHEFREERWQFEPAPGHSQHRLVGAAGWPPCGGRAQHSGDSRQENERRVTRDEETFSLFAFCRLRLQLEDKATTQTKTYSEQNEFKRKPALRGPDPNPTRRRELAYRDIYNAESWSWHVAFYSQDVSGQDRPTPSLEEKHASESLACGCEIIDRPDVHRGGGSTHPGAWSIQVVDRPDFEARGCDEKPNKERKQRGKENDEDAWNWWTAVAKGIEGRGYVAVVDSRFDMENNEQDRLAAAATENKDTVVLRKIDDAKESKSPRADIAWNWTSRYLKIGDSGADGRW